jgi:adenylyltransferase/sulfurtransferase
MPIEDAAERYSRQLSLPGFGVQAQERLLRARVAVVGCGALGSALCQLMVRAGVGTLTVIDSDWPGLSNLPRQILFDEADLAGGRAKAEIAAAKLKAVNSMAAIAGITERLSDGNADRLLGGHDLVLDGTDNMASRLAINRWCVRALVPWVYGAVMFSGGMMMAIRPGKGPCLNCLFPDPLTGLEAASGVPLPIFGAAPIAVASLQATKAVQLLIGSPDLATDLVVIDLWNGRFQRIPVKRDPECPVCNATRLPPAGP